MSIEQQDMTQLARDVGAAMGSHDAQSQRIALATYRELAKGEPATPAAIAAHSGEPAEAVEGKLETWPGVYRDGAGAVIGFWGLAVLPMEIGFKVGDRQLYTWCAWDSLFIPGILGEQATVTARDSRSGEDVMIEVGPKGITNVEPEGAAMSFLRPAGAFDADVVTSFCHHVLFFASRESAERWTAGRPGAFVMSPEEGFELGRLTSEAKFDVALAPAV